MLNVIYGRVVMVEKIFWITVLAAIAVAAVILPAGCSDVPENAAATVNGDVISRDDVADRIRVGAAINPDKVPADTESEEYKELQRGITEQLASEEVEKQEATKRGITVSADEINALVDQVIEDKYLGSLEKMQEDFARRGIMEDDLRQQILRLTLHQKLLDSLRSEVPVSEEEVREKYEASIGNYVYPEKRQVRQVVSADEATAASIAARINAGEDMAVIAGQSSIDGKTKINGGLIGLQSRDALPKAVGDVAFSIGQGQVSEPFKADSSWYVIRVELIQPPSDLTFEQEKDKLTMFLSNQKLVERYKLYLEEIKDEYEIKYADDYAPVEKTGTDTTGLESLGIQP